ncbi:MAG TPA: hypothetical protein VLJ44_08450 [Gaiellaceae bacterium]|nr:hypothetical protein [Gaiellaceae bacterium]
MVDVVDGDRPVRDDVLEVLRPVGCTRRERRADYAERDCAGGGEKSETTRGARRPYGELYVA